MEWDISLNSKAASVTEVPTFVRFGVVAKVPTLEISCQRGQGGTPAPPNLGLGLTGP